MTMRLGIFLFIFAAFWSNPLLADDFDTFNNQSASGGSSSLKGAMLNNEAIMQLIFALQNDPDFQKILQDPAIMRAIKTNDLDALTSNPDFMKLLNNPAIGKIKNELNH